MVPHSPRGGRTAFQLLLAVSALALAACSSPPEGAGRFVPISPAAGDAARGIAALVGDARFAASGKIQHVVVIVQENRSFDDLFQGYPGADTQAYGYAKDGRKIDLKPASLATAWDIGHDSQNYYLACDGTGKLPGTRCKMDGFNQEYLSCGAPHTPQPCPHRNPQYGYVPHDEAKPYFDIAHDYVLADRMFPSNFDGSSFISHQYIIAGQAGASIDYPDNVWGCDGGPTDKIGTITRLRAPGPRIRVCYGNRTLGDELDEAHLTWRYYASRLDRDGDIWSAYQAIKHIRYGPDWKHHVISPQTRFFNDLDNGFLPAVSWVTPTCENSDHAGCNSKHGPQWVASLINAVGRSKFWDSTAIFVMWDDYGGWYDHVPPPHLDYDGLGIRVPLLIVSAYAKRGYVSHVPYEHGSILRFIEDQFGLARLAATDARAASPGKDCFDFTKPPRRFVAIPANLNERYFLDEPLDTRVPDAE